MKINRPKVSAEHFYGQFHNGDHPHFHSINHATKEWWQTHHDLPEKDMDKPVSYKQGGTVKNKKHPAHGIPGVHIVTAEAGEPVFSGRA